MFAEVKAMLPVSGDDYDAEIIMQIKAAALDLTRTSEIILPGVISIERTQSQSGEWTISDNSTVTDELVTTAIATWCNMRIGNPPNYDQLRAAYESMKGSMRLSSSYNQEATTA
ncbi:MAG: hypothetical protein IKG23_03100 [Clostridia bacterium]|nr:hypothetical protein [Clostridia bacterium]